MGGGKAGLERIVHDFVRALEVQGIRVERIFLFGSHARGEASEDSDVDVIVVSRDFSGMSARQRWEVLGRAVASIMEPVEPIACTPEEVEERMAREADFVRYVLTRPETVEYQFGAFAQH